MSRKRLVIVAALAVLAIPSVLLGSGGEGAAADQRFRLERPRVALAGVPFDFAITVLDDHGDVDTHYDGELTIAGLYRDTGTGPQPVTSAGPAERGRVKLEDVILPESGVAAVGVSDPAGRVDLEVRVIPGLLSILPPVLAIILALVLREVLLALFAGIWVGVTFMNGYNPITGLFQALDTYLIGALASTEHAAIVMFSLTLGGMVGVVSRAGGTEGIVAALSRWARTARGGQIATWGMGTFIFFDDYANTLVVGNTMRPLTDKLRISREKLSFVVDATAAPVTSIAVISSWVGFQVGLVADAFKNLGLERDPYLAFIASVPYASYSILMLVFVLLVGVLMRDFGPMAKAERRVVDTGKVLRDGAQPLVNEADIDLTAEEGTPLRWYNAAIPIVLVILVTMFGLYFDGHANWGDEAASKRIGEIIGKADSFHVLMWASFIGAASAIILAVSQRIMTLKKALDAWLSGVKAMLIAMIILVLAWSIGSVCGDLNTADYVIALTKGLLSPHALPVLTFIVAAAIAFSTGTSWATMAILTPIVLPMAIGMTADTGIEPAVVEAIFLGTLGAVLSGAVFGDHCSPISDTTIMSSMTSAADHIDHVRTQMPYALTVATVGCLVGYLPSGWGFPTWASLLLGVAALVGVLYAIGRKVPGRDQITLT